MPALLMPPIAANSLQLHEYIGVSPIGGKGRPDVEDGVSSVPDVGNAHSFPFHERMATSDARGNRGGTASSDPCLQITG